MPEGPAQPLQISDRYTWVFADGTTFSDAIVMDRIEYQALSAAQIKTMKQNRAQAWKQTVDASRTKIYTETERRALRRERRQALQDYIAKLNSELDQVNGEIAAEGG